MGRALAKPIALLRDHHDRSPNSSPSFETSPAQSSG
jgi:urocanate hydratase